MAGISGEQPAASSEPAKARGPGRPFLPGESGNPSGRPKCLAALEAQIRELHGHLALEVLEKLRGLALAGNVFAAKLYLERVLGKARVSDAEFDLDLAEHMRKVARDGADLAIKILGTRIYSMAPKELAEFFRECGGDPAGFIEAAKAAAEQPAVEKVEAKPAAPENAPPAPAEADQALDTPVLPDSAEGWPKP